MKNKIQVSISILCANFASLSQEIKTIEASGAEMVHVDIMDGHFVKPLTMGPMIIKALRPLTTLAMDAHLMVEHPETLFDDLAEAGADSVSIHAECFGTLKAECSGFGRFPKALESFNAARAAGAIKRIQSLGMKALLTVSPGTEIHLIEPVLSILDGVLIMSVHPGFSHQSFIPESLDRVRYVRHRFEGDIAIDGGINDRTGAQAIDAGANILATASYFFGDPDPRACVKRLKSGGI